MHEFSPTASGVIGTPYISRVDQLQIGKECTFDDNPIKTKVDQIRTDLQKLGISNPRIFPVSALIALEAREYENMKDEEQRDDARDDFKRFRRSMKRIGASLMDYMSISPSIKNKFSDELRTLWEKYDQDNDTEADNLRLIELLSGIPALEAAIEEYLIKYSIPARIYDAASVFDAGIQQAKAEEELVSDITSKKSSLADITRTIQQLRNFLTKGKGAKKMKSQLFPEQWKESKVLKRELTALDRDFDLRIREKILYRVPKLDDQGTVSPQESTDIINDFIHFMSELQQEMLGTYANSVENDAKDMFDTLKLEYDEKIKELMGEMPPELKSFMSRFDFTLCGKNRITLKTNQIIKSTTEEYIDKIQREINLEKDGFWKTLWSRLPLTDTTTTEEVTKTRIIKRVVFSDLKDHLNKEASLIRQEGLDNAEQMAQNHYSALRSAMMEEFDKIDQQLESYSTNLQENLSSQKAEKQKLEKFKSTLQWVRNFQEELRHVLDLEA